MIDNKEKKDALLELAVGYRWKIGENLHENLIEAIYTEAEKIAQNAVYRDGTKQRMSFERKVDKIVTSRIFGFPIMFLLLAFVFWITVQGANYPSQILSSILVGKMQPFLRYVFESIGSPWWFTGLFVDGAYLASAWVVAVMLPPMAIFFPFFTLMEDLGYLPRVAFNLDGLFRRAGAHGKQALTMSMGFGCNAAGVVASRIIDSPRERLIAIITNNFALCNGRWPTQILIATIFIGPLVSPALTGIISALSVVSIALLGIAFSIIVSFVLSKTVLKGEASTFSLELPPYRPPKIWQTLYTSLIDRTVFVLWRAVIFAFPAGMVIWLVANVHIGGVSIATHFVNLANPFGLFIGLNGVILLAYIIAVPANEIVIPTVLMLTVLLTGDNTHASGVIFDAGNVQETAALLIKGGWTTSTGICLMLFSLLHNPCSTTIYTIYKETGSMKWTIISTIMPLILGVLVCFFVSSFWKLFV